MNEQKGVGFGTLVLLVDGEAAAEELQNLVVDEPCMKIIYGSTVIEVKDLSPSGLVSLFDINISFIKRINPALMTQS